MSTSSAFSVTIPNPCLQPWAGMTPVSEGRFCSSCQKNVIDFSGLTDAELIDIFSNSSSKICGRFHPDQLNRLLQEPAPGRKAFPAAILTTLLSITGLSAAASRPATTVPFVQTTSPFSVDQSIVPPPVADTLKVITGRMVDSVQQTSLSGATVLIKGTRIGTVTDAEGNFHLNIPQDLEQQQIILRFAFIGYDSKEILVKDNLPLKVALSVQQGQLSGEMIIVRKRTFFGKIKWKWRKLCGRR